MFKNIHSTTIVVSNQDAALDFYVGKLGWEKRIDNTMGPGFRFLTVAPKGAQTEIALALSGQMGPSAPHNPFAGEPGQGNATGVSLVLDNLDEAYQKLSAQGVRFGKPPETMPWGQKATWLFDPDGNQFFVVDGCAAA